MNRNSFLKQILLALIVTVFFASCDKDFNEIGTNIIGDDHFGFEHYTGASIKAYNQKLGPIDSHNLAVNAFGIYDNPAFGKTVANFVTQLEMDTPNPTFKTINTPPAIDSVVMSIPYTTTLASELDADGNKVYSLNTLYGDASSKMKLSIYESGYYLRDLDPSEQLGTEQAFYTDQNALIDSHKIGSRLNNSTVVDNHGFLSENDEFYFNTEEIKEDTYDSEGNLNPPVKSVPAMRLHLDNAFFTAKILNAPSGQLFNNNIFKNYMRGLYFKLENAGSNAGSMTLMNFKNGKITIYYKQDKQIEDNPNTPDVNEEEVIRDPKTLVFKMAGNTVSLLENSNENPAYLNAINNPNVTAGDENLYVRGGEGSMAVIDIFGSTDTYKYIVKKDGAGNVVNDSFGDPLYVKENTPNGVSDELDDLRYPKVDPLDPLNLDHSPKNRWMINEANLTFYVDKTKISDVTSKEPLRVFLYDLTNKTPLIDYYYDGTIDGTDSKKNKSVFGGIIVKETVAGGVRTKYKVKITNHLRNLIMKDSTNVRLGLSITEDITDVSMSKLKTSNTATDKAVKASIQSTLGTILHGTNANVADENRLKLEIYYTKPD